MVEDAAVLVEDCSLFQKSSNNPTIAAEKNNGAGMRLAERDFKRTRLEGLNSIVFLEGLQSSSVCVTSASV